MSNKTSDKNVANIEELIKEYKTYNDLDGIQDLQPYIRALQNILADYTRQKQINEEHRKLNGELRERVKELEEKNKHLSNTSDYETISLECTNLEEQLEIANDRIKELEEELEEFNKQLDLDYVDENFIPKQVVIDTMEELKTKRRKLGFKTYLRREDMLNEDKMIVCKIEVLQKLLDGEK